MQDFVGLAGKDIARSHDTINDELNQGANMGMRIARLTALVCGFLMAAGASASPVALGSVYAQWQYDTALIVPSESYFSIGDCFSCLSNSFDSTRSFDGALGSAIASNRWDSVTSIASSDSDYSFSYHAVSEFFASVDAGLEGASASAGVGLYRFIVDFVITEPVLFTGNIGLSMGAPEFGPVEATISSGTVLQPGQYFTSVSHPKVTITAQAGQIVQDTQSFAFDYSFSRIPTPPALMLCLFGLAAIFVSRFRTAG
jgi:hypothetical protein